MKLNVFCLLMLTCLLTLSDLLFWLAFREQRANIEKAGSEYQGTVQSIELARSLIGQEHLYTNI